jgi:hypothetical protein
MGVSWQEKGRCWLVQVAHPSYKEGKRQTVVRVKDTDHLGGKDEAQAYAKLLFDGMCWLWLFSSTRPTTVPPEA